MAVTAIVILRIKNLFTVVMLGGIYSLLSAQMFVNLDAVDVAFTEAADPLLEQFEFLNDRFSHPSWRKSEGREH